MKILIHDGYQRIGNARAHPESPYGDYLAAELSGRGHEVVFWGGLERQSKDVREVNADVIFTNAKCLESITKTGVNGAKLCVWMHGPTEWFQGGNDYGRRHAALIGFTCQESMEAWSRVNDRARGCFVVSFPLPESYFAAPGESPYAPDERVLLYAGRIGCREYGQWLNLTAKRFPACSVHVIASEFTDGGDAADLTADNIVLHEKMPYGSFCDYEYYADVGLDMARGPDVTIHCKQWGYLARGLPVVYVKNIGGLQPVLATGHGIGVESFGDAYFAAIETALQKDWDRKRAIEYMRTNETYAAFVDRWLEALERI